MTDERAKRIAEAVAEAAAQACEFEAQRVYESRMADWAIAAAGCRASADRIRALDRDAIIASVPQAAPIAWLIHDGNMTPVLTVYSASEAANYHPKNVMPLAPATEGKP